MYSASVFPVILLLVLFVSSASSLKCITDTTYKGVGVDMALSRKHGADARQVATSHVGGTDPVTTCSQLCCESAYCNVAIYMKKFTHTNDKNCLLIKCAPIQKCEWQVDSGFVAAVLRKDLKADPTTTPATITTTSSTSTRSSSLTTARATSSTASTQSETTTKPPSITTHASPSTATTAQQTSPSPTSVISSSTTAKTTTRRTAVVLTGEDKQGKIYAVTGKTMTTTPRATTPNVNEVTTDATVTTQETTSKIATIQTTHHVTSNITTNSQASTKPHQANLTASSTLSTTTVTTMNSTKWTNDTMVESFANLGGKVYVSPTTVGLVCALAAGVFFTVAVVVLVFRRVYDGWQRRHYRKMDYLVDGMYN